MILYSQWGYSFIFYSLLLYFFYIDWSFEGLSKDIRTRDRLPTGIPTMNKNRWNSHLYQKALSFKPESIIRFFDNLVQNYYIPYSGLFTLTKLTQVVMVKKSNDYVEIIVHIVTYLLKDTNTTYLVNHCSTNHCLHSFTFSFSLKNRTHTCSSVWLA